MNRWKPLVGAALGAMTGRAAGLSSPEELSRVQAAEVVKWARVVKESGAKAE